MLAYICKEKQGQVLVLAEQQDLFDSLIVTGNALGSASSPKKPVRTRGHRLRLCQGRLRLNIQKNFLTVSVVKHWNRLLRHVIESPFLKMFKCTWVYTAWWCLVKA